jgi:hypothetical protein
MIGAMKSPEAQYQLAMRLPIAQLQAILRGQPSEIDQPTALTVLKQRMQQKTAMQGVQAQQELQQPSIKDRMLQQAQMPEDMGIAQAPGAQQAGAIPDGGVAGFAEGGDVRHFQTGGTQGELFRTPFDPDVSRQRVIDATRQRIAQFAAQGVPASVAEQAVAAEAAGGPSAASSLSRFFPQVSGQSATMAGLRGLGSLGARALTAATPLAGPAAVGLTSYELAEPVMRATGVTQSVTDYLANLTGLADREKEALTDKPVSKRNTPAASAAPYLDPRRTDVDPNFKDPRGRGATAPAPGPARPRVDASVQMEANPASTPDALDFMTDKAANTEAAPAATDTAGITTLASTAERAAPADTGYESAMRKISGSTQPYMDRMSALLKTMTPTAEEKESRSAERKGVMALKAAQALLQSGTTSGAARGSALGQIAELTQAYGKEDREDKKAMIGAEINMLGAQAQLAQGNSKMAVDMFQHAEKLAAEATRFEAEKLFKQRELDLKEKGLWNEKTQGEEIIKMRRYIADQEAAWRRQHIGVLAGQDRRAELRYDADLARVASQERMRSVQSMIDAQRAILGNTALFAQHTEAAQRLKSLTEQLARMQGFEMPTAAGPGLVDRPGGTVVPGKI